MKGCFSSAVAWAFVLLLPFAYAPPAQAQGITGVCVAFCDDPTPPAADPYPAPYTPQERYTTPRGKGWYCKAKARNGGWGWGEHRAKSTARSIAIESCSTRGQGCSISYCTLNSGAKKKQQTGTNLRSNKKRRGTVSASLCYRKLVADVRSGNASARLNTYISQALAGYANCKRKSFGSTRQGDNYARKLRSALARANSLPSKKSRASKRKAKAHGSAAKVSAVQKKSLLKKRALKRQRDRKARLQRERAELAAAPARVIAAVKRADYKAAVTAQALVVAANKGDAKAWRDFSTYLEKSGRLDDAATALRRAALLSGKDGAPDISAMYRRDALVNAAKGDYGKAIAQQAMALKAGKKDPRLWRQLGEYMEKAGRLDDAATALRRAKTLGGPDPEDKILQMYQRDVLNRAESLDSGDRVAIYRSHIEKYSDIRGNRVRHRLAEELLRQKRTGQAREVYQRIASLDPSDNAAQAALAPSQNRTPAKGSTLSQLEEMRREMQTALIDSGPASAPDSGDLSSDLEEIAGTLGDALRQMEALKKSLEQDRAQGAQQDRTFEAAVSEAKREPGTGQPARAGEPDSKQRPQSARPVRPVRPARQKRQQLKAAGEQWKLILFHYKNAKGARMKARTMNDPSMKNYYMRLAEQNVGWAQGITRKLGRTLKGETAQAPPNALNKKIIQPAQVRKGKAFGQLQRLSGQAAGKNGPVRNLIDGSKAPLNAPPPGKAKPMDQSLFGIKWPSQDASSK